MKRSISAMSMFIVIIGAVLMMPSAVLPALAQETYPCAKDFKEHCGYVTPGGGRLARCYEERKDKMSAACRAWAERAKENAAALKEACSKEIDSWCNFEKGDPFETLDCLQGNYISLSSECIAALNQFKSRYPKPVQ